MPTSLFYNAYNSTNEQQLLDDLVNESIRIHGLDFYYVARNLGNFDKILGEDDQSSYTRTWLIAGLIKDIFGYSGAGSLMSKFGGLEIKDQIIVSIGVSEFRDEVTDDENSITRPREGDLLFFPLHKKSFQISFVNQLEFFYPLGNLTTYECTADLFTYSGEVFNTGIEDIDKLYEKFSENTLVWAFRDSDGEPLRDENGDYYVVDNYSQSTIDPMNDSDEFTKEGKDIVDFTMDDPFADGVNKII